MLLLPSSVVVSLRGDRSGEKSTGDAMSTFIDGFCMRKKK
jgi:hypothetical protein